MMVLSESRLRPVAFLETLEHVRRAGRGTRYRRSHGDQAGCRRRGGAWPLNNALPRVFDERRERERGLLLLLAGDGDIGCGRVVSSTKGGLGGERDKMDG